MIPNIFVSSTIRDLHYLREAVRETILDLAYTPVMSEYGEVGYLHPTTAASSCYRSVEQCQMFVLIVGRRYSAPSDGGLSVTHREFKSAQEYGIPTITFVEPQVISYREVYEADPENQMWNAFPHMDNPRRTFQLLDDIGASTSYNAIIPFHDVGDAKRKLKLQIADFVGTHLQNAALAYRADLHEVLAELKTIRNQLSGSGNATSRVKAESRRYLLTMRFLLDEKHADYRKFLVGLTGDIDAALPTAMKAKNFEDLLKKLGCEVVRYADDKIQEELHDKWHQMGITGMTYSVDGGYATTSDKRLLITPRQEARFDLIQKALRSKLDTDPR